MSTYANVIQKPGFAALLATQFLAMFNDQAFKIAASMAALKAGHDGVISLFGALFVLPFLLFGGFSGQVADKFRKRSVIITIKFAEIAFMALGIAALWTGNVPLMAAVVFLMGTHTAFMTPARLGIVPEIVDTYELSLANGLVDTSSFLAVIAGTAAGSVALAVFRGTPQTIAMCLTGVAVAGAFLSLLIRPARTVASENQLRSNPFPQLVRGLHLIRNNGGLLLSCLSLSFFWLIAALYQMNLLLFSKEQIGASEAMTGILVACLAIGIAIGNVVAGRISGGRIQTGMVPFGCLGLGVLSIVLSRFARTPVQAGVMLAAMGFAGGIFMVPMGALMLKAAPESERGGVIATSSFVTTIGTLSSAGILWLLHDLMHIPASRIFVICGITIIIAAMVIARYVFPQMIRFILVPLIGVFYRIRVRGVENIPATGPVLLIANHVSFIDGLLISWAAPRNIRFLVHQRYFNQFRWILEPMGAIPVPIGKRGVLETLARARKQLADGRAVCLFPEGNITHIGTMLPFKPGVERILRGTDVPVIPVYLDGVWGSIFSFERGRFLWKWPKRVPYHVTVSFAPPVPATSTAAELRQAVVELGALTAETRPSRESLGSRFLEAAKANGNRLALADSTGKELTYRRALIASLLIADWFKRERRTQKQIGLLLPSTVGAALSNLGVTLSGKVAVNLNFTTGPAMDSAIEQCQLETIVTSRAFLEKINLPARPEMVYVEDLVSSFSSPQKTRMALLTRLPAVMLARVFGIHRDGNQLAAIIFSSGTTGTPKGVMLSHKNLLSTIGAVDQVCEFGRNGCLAGLLPFFHSFGFTITLWFPMVNGLTAAYHPNPADAAGAGELVQRYRANLLLSTPTFTLGYIRACTPEQFASLKYVFVGAERLRETIAATFEKKFGIPLLEGYGATEMAPVVALNLPDVTPEAEPGDVTNLTQVGGKLGSVGRPLPGIAVRAVHPETFEVLPVGSEGLLMMRGPNRMMGYWYQPEKTAAALRDGWYVSGDLGTVDAAGFVSITGRLARFSKIAGEMIPHEKVEQALSEAIPGIQCVVTAVPDAARGERLVVLCADPEMDLAGVAAKLAETNLPKLWIPKRDSFFPIDAIPVLATGKTNLSRVRELALSLSARKETLKGKGTAE